MAINPTRALQRSISVARLHVPTFEEVEADTSATGEAGAVLVVSAIIGSVGSLFTNGLWGFLAMIVVMIAGWFVWAWSSAQIAERVFGVQTTNTGEMLRVLGYGSDPRALGLIPFLGFVALIWTLVTLVYGIRQAGEMTTGGAAITGFLGLIPTVVAMVLITALL